jgi:SAM-dependent methyltransferase
MSIEVLYNPVDNIRARDEIRRRRLDFFTPRVLRALRKARLISGVNVGDLRKSWDLLKTVEFLERRVNKSSAVLDIGACSSEVLCALHELGYSDLAGIDLNPRIALMPHAGTIRYMVGDFIETPFPSETFEAITAISVLEHGYCGPKVFSEVSRILKPGGYFIGSVDYWPDKIDTSEIKVYGLDWKIFSKDELLSLIVEAGNRGMVPVGQLNFVSPKATVSWSRKKYTFAWFAFQKGNAQETN